MTDAHAFRHIAHMPYVSGLVQVGIRSLRNTEEVWNDTRNDGNTVVTTNRFRQLGPEGVARLVPRGSNCYISLGVDVFDVSLVPGCVSAEPEGLSYAEVRDTPFALAEATRIVGFDLVEINPVLDVGAGVTAYLGAHTIVEFLGHICKPQEPVFGEPPSLEPETLDANK